MKYVFAGIISIFMLIILSGCLTCEKKEYTFEVKKDGSGKLTIVFHNIMSSMEDNVDMTEKDFTELESDYLEGKKLQEDYPNCKIRKQKLYEKNGVLNGKVIIYFDKMEDVGLYQHEGKGPYLLSLCGFSESYSISNGSYGGEKMPVVFWDKSLNKLTLTTTLDEPSEENISLLNEFKKRK
jgi:hypothetical protein